MLNGVLDDHIVVYGKGLVHMLDFRIHTFLCVCRHMNYTKAAAELQITQPAVSQHIRHLEKEYQTKLFDYTGKRLELTQAGQILLNAATTISHDNVMLKQRLQDLQQTNKSVAFGATHTIGEFEIIDRLADFLHEHADVNIRMKIADTDKLLKAVDEGIIDFAIVEGFFDQDQYETLLFSNEPLIAVCGPDYDAPSEMYLADLMRYRLIVREKSAGTRELLEREGMDKRARLILCGHEHMDRYLEPERVDGICFNFGYLPGGDHELATRADTSVKAVDTGLALLKRGGVMALCIYSGGDTGYEEKEKILEYLKALDEKRYLVIMNSFYNRKKDPPLPVFVVKK